MNWATSSSWAMRAGGDLLALAVEAADEAHLVEQVLRRVADEVEDAVLLANLRRLHRLSPGSARPSSGRCRAEIYPESGPAQRSAPGISPDRRAASGPAGPRRWRGSARKRPRRSAPARPWAAAAGSRARRASVLEFERPDPLQHHVVVRQRLAAVFARFHLGNQLVFIGAEVERGVGLRPARRAVPPRLDLEGAWRRADPGVAKSAPLPAGH